MFKRFKRFQWPAHENLVQIPPNLPMPKPVIMKIDMATGEDYTGIHPLPYCSIHSAFEPTCPWCSENLNKGIKDND